MLRSAQRTGRSAARPVPRVWHVEVDAQGRRDQKSVVANPEEKPRADGLTHVAFYAVNWTRVALRFVFERVQVREENSLPFRNVRDLVGPTALALSRAARLSMLAN